MATVRELFDKLFAYVLLFEQSSRQDESQPSYDEVWGTITTMLQQQQEVAKRQGMQEREYQDARFAFVAWADETILKHTAWADHPRWKNHPLQLEYFQTRNAGEELFERLERLPAEQREMRDVYYLGFGLGFRGRYFLGLEDEFKLNQIRHEQAQRLSLRVENVRNIEHITPQPYQAVPPLGRPIKAPITHLLLKVGLALLVLIPLAFLAAYMINRQPLSPLTPPMLQLRAQRTGNGSGAISSTPAGILCGATCEAGFAKDTAVTLQATPDDGAVFAGWSGAADCIAAEPIVTVHMTADKTCSATFALRAVAALPAPPLQQRMAQRIQALDLSCTAVTFSAHNGVITLSGRVASETQRDELSGALQDLDGVTQVHDTTQLIPRPFCEVVELLEPVQAAAAAPVTMQLNKGPNPTYYKDENLVIDVQTPGLFGSYVYADYYTADGSVGHLFPNPLEPSNRLEPNNAVTVGRLDGPQPWLISPPFGLELITVITSKTPLFVAPRSATESVQLYLPALRQAVGTIAPPDIAATFHFLMTQQ